MSNIENGPSRWYIDAWEPRGGRAFASLRTETVPSSIATNYDTTVYIGPPGFEPRSIVNTSVALAAIRNGQAWPRVPLGETGEIAFPTARTAAEFVRRGFIAGRSGSDGERGSETPPTPEFPSLGNDGERTPLQGYVSQFEAAGKAGDKDENGDRQAPRLNGPSALSVKRGAVLILHQVLVALHHRHIDEAWTVAVRDLHFFLDELRIWHWLKGSTTPPANDPTTEAAIALLKPPLTGIGPLRADQIVAAASLVLLHGKITDELAEHFMIMRHWYRHYGYLGPYWPWHSTGPGGGPRDRYAALFRWPVHGREVAGQRIVNLGQLLTSFVAAPQNFANLTAAEADMIMFAAAVLGAHGRDAQEKTLEWQDDAALAWLNQSLPHLMLPQAAEQLVASGACAEIRSD